MEIPTHRCLPMLVLAGCMSTACAGHIWWPGALTDYRVASHGQDSGADSCRDFSLTAAQARWFFGRARMTAATPEHASCWVRGTARGADGTWEWEIRADGAARLVAPDGEVKILACSNCRAVLPGPGTTKRP